MKALEIVDFRELSSILKVNPKTFRKRWRDLPHFFVGTGHQIDSARFNLDKVLKFLEQESAAFRQDRKNLDRAGDVPRAEGPAKGIRDKGTRQGLGSARKKKAKVSSSDPASPGAKPRWRVLSVLGDKLP